MEHQSGSGRWKWIVGVCAIIVLAAFGIWFVRERKAGAAQYQTVPVTRGDLIQLVTASGQLNPVVNVQVGSQISGRIRDIYVDFNSTVQSNEVIAQIDPSTYQVGVLRAEAQLSNSLANLSLARIQATRAAALFQDNLIAAADHDTAVAQLQQAEAQVVSDQANLESAQVDLSRCTIRAPVDGVVISRAVDVGQTVAASFNTPTLFLIANDLAKMQIDALVSEADIGGVALKQNVNFTVDAYPERQFHGVVNQIRYGPVTNQNVVNYDAVIAVNNDDLKLLPGMTANVSIIVAERDGVLKIPNAALRFRPPEASGPRVVPGPGTGGPRAGGPPGAPAGGGAGTGGGESRGRGPGGGRRGGPAGDALATKSNTRTVYVLQALKDAEKPALVPVKITTGISDGVSTEVLDGLKEGDEVVTGLMVTDAGDQPVNPFAGRRRF
jgi:HlyD family secretion protein